MQTAFSDLPAEAFPLTVEMLNRSGVAVWSVVIEGPGVVQIPPLAQFYGPVGCRVRFADGEQTLEPPPGGWLRLPA